MAKPSGSADANGGALLRHDTLILRRALGATFARWPDRILALVALALALVAIHGWFTGKTWRQGALLLAGAGALTGMFVARLIIERLDYHATDGVLAVQALAPTPRRIYWAAGHLTGVVVVAVFTLTARPGLLFASLPAYGAAAMLAQLWRRTYSAGLARSGAFPALRDLARSPIAGAVAGVVWLVSLAALVWPGDDIRLIVVAGMEALLLGLALTLLNPARICFMLQAGYGPSAILIRHSAALGAFSAVSIAGSFLFGWKVAVTVGLIVAAAALLLAIRLFAYAVHSKRVAEWHITLSVAALGLVGWLLPPLLPPALLILLWELHRRARAGRWLLR